MFTFTLDKHDTRYRSLEVYLVASWVTGVPWNATFVDSNYDELDNNLIRMDKAGQETISLIIRCDEPAPLVILLRFRFMAYLILSFTIMMVMLQTLVAVQIVKTTLAPHQPQTMLPIQEL